MSLPVHRPGEVAFCKGLIHGPHGAGKTTLLATADDDERTSPALFLNFEGGTRSIVGRDIDVFDVHDWEDYNQAYAELSNPKTKYRSALIDSLSETQVFGLLHILDTDKKRPDPNILAEADWGVILLQMRRFVRHFRDLPMHVFMSALAGPVTLPRLGTVQAPLLQGKIAQDLPGIMDIVGYLAVDEWEDNGERFVQRALLLANNPKYSVKARKPIGLEIPDELVDPTIGGLLDTLGYKEAKAA